MNSPDLLTEAQGSSPSTSVIVAVGIAIVALMIAAGAIEASSAALFGLIRELLGALFANIGRLLLIGLCVICLVVFLASQHGAGPTGTS